MIPQRGREERQTRQGFTLIELLIAMALFALISLAGFAMLRGILGTRDRLDGRLAQVGELQRGLYLMTLDLESMTTDPLNVTPDTIGFRRTPAAGGQGAMRVRYVLKDHGLHRITGDDADQIVIPGVSSVQWRVLDAAGVWSSPPSGPPMAGVADRPRAVEVGLVLDGDAGGLSGPLRRVIELPARP